MIGKLQELADQPLRDSKLLLKLLHWQNELCGPNFEMVGRSLYVGYKRSVAGMDVNEAATLMVMKAAALYDAGKSCGAEANAAKYLAGEACFDACQQAVMTHGGFGYAREYHVERYLRAHLPCNDFREIGSRVLITGAIVVARSQGTG
mgnify:CR=1 FL=1